MASGMRLLPPPFAKGGLAMTAKTLVRNRVLYHFPRVLSNLVPFLAKKLTGVRKVAENQNPPAYRIAIARRAGWSQETRQTVWWTRRGSNSCLRVANLTRLPLPPRAHTTWDATQNKTPPIYWGVLLPPRGKPNGLAG